LRRTTPLSDVYGRDRGTPIDRYYIEGFLERERRFVVGDVLELLDDSYTVRFGSGVRRADVLDVDRGNRRATVVADLAAADPIPSEAYDCVILTQTLQYIYDVEAAVGHVRRILKPGGVVLCTVPCASRIDRRALDSEYWRFTTASARTIFERSFGAENVAVEAHGNVLACVAFFEGIAAEELSRSELGVRDPLFPLVVTVRARRAA
jgi:SAM-dependent methyltransferase